MLADRTDTAARPLTQRSRATNGKSLFAEGGDMRGPWARRLRDVLGLHLSDIGGIEAASEAERSILRRAAVLTVELERLEARFAVNDTSSADDLDLYQRTAGNLRRLLESVGLQRRPRDVTPSLEGYLAARPAMLAQDAANAPTATQEPIADEDRTSGHASEQVAP
jgi:hypothetical protein